MSGHVMLQPAQPRVPGWLYGGQVNLPGDPVPALKFRRGNVLVLSSFAPGEGRGVDYHVSASTARGRPTDAQLRMVVDDFRLPEGVKWLPTNDPRVVHLFAPVPADELPGRPS